MSVGRAHDDELYLVERTYIYVFHPKKKEEKGQGLVT
jgi:hypothetical protein